jgi:hypothetical protein
MVWQMPESVSVGLNRVQNEVELSKTFSAPCFGGTDHFSLILQNGISGSGVMKCW